MVPFATARNDFPFAMGKIRFFQNQQSSYYFWWHALKLHFIINNIILKIIIVSVKDGVGSLVYSLVKLKQICKVFGCFSHRLGYRLWSFCSVLRLPWLFFSLHSMLLFPALRITPRVYCMMSFCNREERSPIGCYTLFAHTASGNI